MYIGPQSHLRVHPWRGQLCLARQDWRTPVHPQAFPTSPSKILTELSHKMPHSGKSEQRGDAGQQDAAGAPTTEGFRGWSPPLAWLCGPLGLGESVLFGWTARCYGDHSLTTWARPQHPASQSHVSTKAGARATTGTTQEISVTRGQRGVPGGCGEASKRGSHSTHPSPLTPLNVFELTVEFCFSFQK